MRIKKIGLLLVAMLLLPTCVFAGDVGHDLDTKDYVILLHGLGRTTQSMSKIEDELKKAGYFVRNVRYPSRKYPVETLVDNYVGPAIQDCGQAKTIHFVTHSLGGILVRYYLDQVPLQNLGRVVMLSPPNQGSEVVDKLGDFFLYKWCLGPAFQQLSTCPNSIPNQLPSPNFDLGIITGTKSINPLFSSFISGQDDGKVGVESARIQGVPFKTVPVTHTWIMRDRQVIKDIVHFLEFGSFIEE